MKVFSLKGLSSTVEIAVDKESSKVVRDLRESLAKRKVPPEAAERLIDDLLLTALTRLGRNFERVKGKHIDTVVKLRGELDGLFAEMFVAEGAGSKAGMQKALESRLPKIKQHYAELDKAIADATLPLDKMHLATEADEAMLKAVQGVEKADLPQGWRPVSEDLAKEAKYEHRIARKLRDGFEKLADGGFKTRFADGTETVLRIKNDRYTAEIFQGGMKAGKEPIRVQEYQLSIDPYGVKGLPCTGLLQRNHVVQNAMMEKLFGAFGYDGNKVPTMWLRNSRTGSPHGKVTANQRKFNTELGSAVDDAERIAKQMQRGKTADLSPGKMNLGELQSRGIAEMRALGANDAEIAAYLKQFDRHFSDTVLPKLQEAVKAKKMSQAQMDSLLGEWKPGAGLAK